MNDSKNNKIELRSYYRALRNSFSTDFVKEASRLSCELLVKTDEFSKADTVLLYYPINNEISPLEIFEKAQNAGKTVGFPRCDAQNTSLTFCKVTDLNQLKIGHFGLPEPDESCERIICNEKTLVLVPALLFSESGHRLGYGKGYYDRFLRDFEGVSIGLSYSKTLCASLQHEEHDVPLDMIITEREVLDLAQKN